LGFKNNGLQTSEEPLLAKLCQDARSAADVRFTKQPVEFHATDRERPVSGLEQGGKGPTSHRRFTLPAAAMGVTIGLFSSGTEIYEVFR
jgi:hypothetical protein